MNMINHPQFHTVPSKSCQTAFPIVLLHGIGLRDDMRLLNSWGRIPRILEAHGAQIFLGGLDAWNTHENSAAVLKPRIDEILAHTGTEKVNIIAHSKGGLEARYLISKLGMADKIASLTTVCTPHRGTCVADLVVGDIPDKKGLLKTNLFRWLAQKLGFGALDILGRIIGDNRPQAKLAITQLTRAFLAWFNLEVVDAPGVYYQSYGTVMKQPIDDPIFAATYVLMLEYERENDGMVSTHSCQWGNFRGLIRTKDPSRGISHGDMVDYRGAMVTTVDIPQVYINMVEDLKQRGY
jgi:triacylglycerol lipase